MPFAAALSTTGDTCRAANEAASEALNRLGMRPEAAIAFYSPHHESQAEELAATLASNLNVPNLIGCQGESIVGNRREVENAPALSLWLGSWNGAASIETFHLQTAKTPDGPTLLGWPDALTEADPKTDVLLLLGDPFTLPTAELLLPFLNDDYPGLPLVGGMASGMSRPGERILIRNGEVLTAGGVGVLLRGPMRWCTVVSQGARPIGRPLVITKGSENIIAELGGQKPLDYARKLFEELPEADRRLVRQGLMIGLAMSEYRDTFQRGDFLIRSLYGFDGDSGALAIADRVRLGQTVQFQLRDAEAADEELRLMLRRAKSDGANPAGGLLFSCNGRGTRMFPAPDHDASAIQEEAGPLPLAGFFAAGELGPVAGRNYIHGFTASVVLFE